MKEVIIYLVIDAVILQRSWLWSLRLVSFFGLLWELGNSFTVMT